MTSDTGRSIAVDASVLEERRNQRVVSVHRAATSVDNGEHIESDEMPVVPDPLWPQGALPTHLKKEAAKQEKGIIDAAWEAVGVDGHGHWRCAECGSTTQRSIRNPQLCATCYAKAEEQTKLMRRTNEGWMEQAQQLGLALYERQPEETDNEWIVWERYRSYYPLAMPKWSDLAKEVGLSVAFVTKTAQRWNFKARMIQWAKAVDSAGQEKRIKAIREMNAKQLSMAQRLHEKVAAAIDEIDPSLLRPNEIVALAKFGTELERNITTYKEEKVESTAVAAAEQPKQRTKAEDLQEVMAILQQTGVVQPGAVVGVEQRTTVLVKGGAQGDDIIDV